MTEESQEIRSNKSFLSAILFCVVVKVKNNRAKVKVQFVTFQAYQQHRKFTSKKLLSVSPRLQCKNATKLESDLVEVDLCKFDNEESKHNAIILVRM